MLLEKSHGILTCADWKQIALHLSQMNAVDFGHCVLIPLLVLFHLMILLSTQTPNIDALMLSSPLAVVMCYALQRQRKLGLLSGPRWTMVLLLKMIVLLYDVVNFVKKLLLY